ncbi:unnamed protein product [Arabis nemorensis]|uniref:Uncharacterized protein n=1 Tax=Arabis nemorensis TaxID=586526 RepID=A0A565B653_9BRAS|nr:unnamed protein product [Arabis nemorensis]
MSRLRSSKRMLQMPALLDEQGTTTSSVPNTFLVAFSYFNLSICDHKLFEADILLQLNSLDSPPESKKFNGYL